MKKLILALLIATTSCSIALAQDTIRLKNANKNPKSERYKVVTDRPPQAILAELGGASITIAVNYDRRFNKRTDGFGFRIGISPLVAEYNNGFMYNLGINHLEGNNKKGRFLESGINITTINFRNFRNNSQSETLLSFTFGYRSQPVMGGFCFRAGLNLFFTSDEIVPWPYLSFGFNF